MHVIITNHILCRLDKGTCPRILWMGIWSYSRITWY